VLAGAVVKAVHVTEARARIDALRRRFGLETRGPWTGVIPGTLIQAVHIVQMQNALASLHARICDAAYLDMIAAGTLIQASVMTELRDAITALEAIP
jgi:hypothetical protein